MCEEMKFRYVKNHKDRKLRLSDFQGSHYRAGLQIHMDLQLIHQDQPLDPLCQQESAGPSCDVTWVVDVVFVI